MKSSILAIGVFVAVLLVGAAAYALNGYAHGGEPTAPTTGSPSQYPMMGGMGGMMGQEGHEEQPMAGPGGGMGPGDLESCIMDEMFSDFDGMDDMMVGMEDGFGRLNMVEVNGTVVEVIDRGNKLVVDTGDANVTVRVMNMYIDTSNGYLFSGVWLTEQLEEAIADGATIQVSVSGVGGERGLVALSITVDGLGSYALPMYYDSTR